MWSKLNIVYFKVLYLQLPGRFTLGTSHIQIFDVPATPPGTVWAFKYPKVVNFHYKYQKMILLCCILGKVGYNDRNATCYRSIGGKVYYVENVREVNWLSITCILYTS